MIGVFDRVKGWLFEDGGAESLPETPPPIESIQSLSRRSKKASLLSLHNNRGEEIFIRRPNNREDAPFCADCLRSRSAVVVNLNSMEETDAKRFFDFLAGVVYAIDGQMESVGENIFLLTPRDVEIATENDEQAKTNSEEVGFWQEV
jgi:FtsZ-interacting cell division protein YlmF